MRTWGLLTTVVAIAVVAVVLAARWQSAGSWSVQPWDAGWYAGLAAEGYRFDGDYLKQHNIAFFPAFPAVVALATAVFAGNAALASFLVGLAASAAGTVLWFRTLSRLYAPPVPFVATALTLTYPFAFFLVSGYAEALMFLATAGFFHAWVGRRRALAAGLFIGLAAVSKPAGITLLLVPMLELSWEALRAANGWRDLVRHVRNHAMAWLVMPLIALAGLVAFQAYLWVRFGDPLLYRHLHRAWMPEMDALMPVDIATLNGLFEVGRHLAHDPLNNPIAWGVLALIGLPIMALRWWRMLPPAFVIQCALLPLVLYPFSFAHPVFLQNSGRYALMFLPGFVAIALALVAGDRRRGEAHTTLAVAPVPGVPRASIPPLAWVLIALQLALMARFVLMFYRMEWVS